MRRMTGMMMAVGMLSGCVASFAPAPPEMAHREMEIGDVEFHAVEARARAGDKDAALRLAQMFQRGSNGLPRDEHRMVQWLRHASNLQNGRASYLLYLHYLEKGLDRDALFFERRAVEQGYVPPPRLEHRRG
jgi:TPR repeat protein